MGKIIQGEWRFQTAITTSGSDTYVALDLPERSNGAKILKLRGNQPFVYQFGSGSIGYYDTVRPAESTNPNVHEFYSQDVTYGNTHEYYPALCDGLTVHGISITSANIHLAFFANKQHNTDRS